MVATSLDPVLSTKIAEREQLLDCTGIGRGYTVAEIRAAFDMVCDPLDWKAEVTATVNPALWPLVKAAVEFYTATTPRIISVDPDNGRFKIVADGYRMGPAGDH